MAKVSINLDDDLDGDGTCFRYNKLWEECQDEDCHFGVEKVGQQPLPKHDGCCMCFAYGCATGLFIGRIL